MALSVQTVSWPEAGNRCSAIRESVFIHEQGIDRAIELDGLDPQCSHVLAQWQQQDVGTARMQPDGHIGRVAVLAAWRKRGIGQALMLALCELARRQGLATVHLASQESAIAFYQGLGFRCEGAAFMEAGIPHQNMILTL